MSIDEIEQQSFKFISRSFSISVQKDFPVNLRQTFPDTVIITALVITHFFSIITNISRQVKNEFNHVVVAVTKNIDNLHLAD